MKVWNLTLDIIALTEEQLLMERVVQKLPLAAALVVVLAVIVAVIIRKRRR